METQVQTDQNSNSASNNPATTIAASIVVAAVLISGSVFYNTKVLITQLKGDNVLANSETQQGLGNQGGGEQVLGQQILPDTGPVEVPERSNAATLGKSTAPVTIVEFTDFQCPFCQRFYNDTYKKLVQKYVDTGKVKFVFRHYPLTFHQNAIIAGQAAECANLQGKFVPYHDVLFTKGQGDGTGLDSASLKIYAKDLGLNTQKFNSCLDNNETRQTVTDDMDAGTRVGVTGTPTFFINGQRIVGAMPTANFEQIIEQELAK